LRSACNIFVLNLKRRDHLEILGVNERIILKRILEKMVFSMDLIHLARDRNNWRILVTMAMSLRVP
jgi:hypothetical protein